MSGAVHYFNVEKQYKAIEPKVQKRVKKLLKSGRYVLGQEVADFEKKFAKFCGARYAIGVGSGTDALIFGLKSLGIGPKDQVLVPSFTFVATVFAIQHVGAEPIFVDVDPQTYTLDADQLESAITKRTKAILPVHLYGQSANLDGIMKVAKKHKLFVVEDTAQAHGARWKKKVLGSVGDVGCFSFYPTKNLGACGDGGIVVTNKKSVYEAVRRYRNLGRSDMGDHQEAAWTSRLDAMQAAILNIKLDRLPSYNKNRQKIARRYIAGLKNTPIITPYADKNGYHVYHLFVALVPGGKRDALRKYLASKKIPTMVHYPKAVHQQPAYTKVYKRKWNLPVTKKLSSQIISLPMYPEMPLSHVDKVCAAIRKFYNAS